MKLLVAAALLALPFASILAPTASATCASLPVVVDGQTVALLIYDQHSPGGPICVTRLIVYDCTAAASTGLTVSFTCSSTPVLVL